MLIDFRPPRRNPAQSPCGNLGHEEEMEKSDCPDEDDFGSLLEESLLLSGSESETEPRNNKRPNRNQGTGQKRPRASAKAGGKVSVATLLSAAGRSDDMKSQC